MGKKGKDHKEKNPSREKPRTKPKHLVRARTGKTVEQGRYKDGREQQYLRSNGRRKIRLLPSCNQSSAK
jgi:hypothetical protein